MAEVLNTEIKKLDFVIFDFDGTLMRLNVNWREVRTNLGLDSIEQIWNLSKKKQSKAWETVTIAELEAVSQSETISTTSALLPDLNFGVLTNNCEEAVSDFLISIGINPNRVPIVGRNWLQTSKKDFERFRQAILHLVSSSFSEKPSELDMGYLGDSTYELEYALQLGIKSFLVENDGSIKSYRGQGNE